MTPYWFLSIATIWIVCALISKWTNDSLMVFISLCAAGLMTFFILMAMTDMVLK